MKLSPVLELISKRSFKLNASFSPKALRILSDTGVLVSCISRDPQTGDYFFVLAKFEEDFKVCGSLIEIESTPSPSSAGGVIETPSTAA